MRWNVWVLWLSILYFVIVSFEFSQMASGDVQQIRSCYCFKCHSVQSMEITLHAFFLYMGHTFRPALTWLTVASQDWRLCSAGKEQCFTSGLQKILDPNWFECLKWDTMIGSLLALTLSYYCSLIAKALFCFCIVINFELDWPSTVYKLL